MTATVLLARHGETTWNRAGRIQGWAPTPLTDRGRRQARRLAAGVADEYGVETLYCSDLRRAKETVRPVARELGVEPTFEAAWRERDFGALQGLSAEELFDEFPEYALRAVGFEAATASPPSGESVLEARTRVLDRWNRLCEGVADGETALVVAHNGPIRFVVGELQGLDLVTTMTERSHANAAVTAVEVDGDERRIVRENVVFD